MCLSLEFEETKRKRCRDLDVFNKSSLRGHVNAYEMKASESRKHISLL